MAKSKKGVRKSIKRMTAAGATMRQIAKKIGRAPSTIWRWQHA